VCENTFEEDCQYTWFPSASCENATFWCSGGIPSEGDAPTTSQPTPDPLNPS
jgi:hypothetical protein